MSNLEIEKVLAQMRTMSAPASGMEPEKTKGADFSELLKQSIDKVNDTQMEAGRLSKAFEMGDPDTNLSEVMVSLQKAGISFQAMLQVRNKLVDAYRDVMNMPM